MKARIFITVLLAFFCFTFIGCAGFAARQDSPAKTTDLLEPSLALKFSDVPVPADFKLSPKDSYSFETSGVRVGVLKYRGKANPDQVISFYKEQMPMYNWNLLNVVEYGERLLNFERENETCIISLLPKGKAVTITVSLGPKPQIPLKKLKQPIK